jgi:Transposase DDE domain
MSTSQTGAGEGGVFRFFRRVNANADLDSLAARFTVEARAALQEHLAALFQPEAAQPEHSEEQSANHLLRNVWIEPLFGEGKQWHGMRRFRPTRGTGRVNGFALVIASGQNLKRLRPQARVGTTSVSD